MAQNQAMTNQSAFYNTFKISLTRGQQDALADMLPKRYSLHLYKSTRSIDDESMPSESLKNIKKKHIQVQKDPDYSVSIAPTVPKEIPAPKIQSAQVIPGGQPFMECYLILKKLKKSMYAWPFKTPVDPKALGIPQYFNIVLEPMDLKTIEENLRKEAYKHPAEFHRDIYKTMMNSYKFNQRNSEVFAATGEFQEEYLKICKQAKEGKLVMQANDKKIKMENNMSEDLPILKDKYSSMEAPQIQEQPSLPPPQLNISQPLSSSGPPIQKAARHYIKRQKPEKTHEQKQKQKIRQKQRERELQKQRQRLKIQEQQKQKQRQRQRERQHERQRKQQKAKMQSGQLISHNLFDDYREKEEIHDYSQPFEPSQRQNFIQYRDQKQSVSNEPAHIKIKKEKSQNMGESKNRDRKSKFQMTESLKQIKQLKEVTLVQNQKNIVMNQIQKKLADLIKRMNQYQVPKPKGKNPTKNIDGQEHPNFNNFSNITASEKKKLAQRIALLPSSQLKYVIQICYRNKRNKVRDQQGIYQIDLEKTDPKILKQLSNFVAMRTRMLKKTPKIKDQSIKQINQTEIINNDPIFSQYGLVLQQEQIRIDHHHHHHHHHHTQAHHSRNEIHEPLQRHSEQLDQGMILDDRQDFHDHHIYQQGLFNFPQRRRYYNQMIDINNSDEQSYQPEDDEGQFNI